MARIYGWHGPAFAGIRPSPLEALATRSRRPGWRSASVVHPAAEFGVTGPTGASIAQSPKGAVVVDGFVYNASELGVPGTPADVVLALWERHGVDGMLQRVNGDLSIALHDRSDDVLYLARDRIGVQPLYFATVGRSVAFASQPGPLLSLAGVSRRPDPSFVARFAGSHYRTFDNDPTASPYEGVAQVPAGHVAESRSGRVSLRRYWEMFEQDEFGASEGELAEQYRDLLIDAVRSRLSIASRPTFTLSGGMDSSSVLACAVEVLGSPQEAFSSVYADATFDERDEIATMFDTKVSQWHPVAVDDPDVMGLVSEMVAVHEEPVATATWLSHFLLARQVADAGFDVLFGGLGGDELNAGEYEYFFFHFADLMRAGRTVEFAHEVECWAEHHDHPIYRKDRAVAEAEIARQVDLATPGRCLPNLDRMRRYAPAINRDYFDLAGFEPVMERPFTSYLKNRTHQDIVRETAPCCLRAEDRHASAMGISRCDPFFDYRLVEFMFRVPGALKIRDGVTKRLLREAMRGILPEETRARVKKTGWNAPAHVWFTGEGAKAVHELVNASTFADRGIYDVREVNRLLIEHEEIVRSGQVRENHMMFLWQLVNLELWLRWVDDGAGS